MKKVEELVVLVNKWAEEKGIHEKGNLFSQVMKTYEEIGELIVALHNKNREELIDSIGDIQVCLINACWFIDKGLFIEAFEKKEELLKSFSSILDKKLALKMPFYVPLKDASSNIIDLLSEEDKKVSIVSILFTLEVICTNEDLDMVECLESAYNVIAKRTGHMDSNGQFIKDK